MYVIFSRPCLSRMTLFESRLTKSKLLSDRKLTISQFFSVRSQSPSQETRIVITKFTDLPPEQKNYNKDIEMPDQKKDSPKN